MKSKSIRRKRKPYKKSKSIRKRNTYKMTGGFAEYIPINYVGYVGGYIKDRYGNPHQKLMALSREWIGMGGLVFLDKGSSIKSQLGKRDQKDTLYLSISPMYNTMGEIVLNSQCHVHLFAFTDDTMQSRNKRDGQEYTNINISNIETRSMYLSHVHASLQADEAAVAQEVQAASAAAAEAHRRAQEVEKNKMSLDRLRRNEYRLHRMVGKFCLGMINMGYTIYHLNPTSFYFSLDEDPYLNNYIRMDNITNHNITDHEGDLASADFTHIYNQKQMTNTVNFIIREDVLKELETRMKNALKNGTPL